MSTSLKQKRSSRVRYILKKRNKDRLRLSVFKSAKNLYVQVIDDNASKTICSASSLAISNETIQILYELQRQQSIAIFL